MERGFTFNSNSYNNFLSSTYPTNTTSRTSSSGIIFDSCSSSSVNMMTTCANPIMNSEIWSKLPETLIDRVIAFLPPPAFFDARSVCKRWSNLLISNSFIEMYLSISSSARQQQRHTRFLFFKHKNLKSYIPGINYKQREKEDDSSSYQGYLFDPNEMKWYKISFGSVIPSGFSPCSSSGGLICWVSDVAGIKNLILCNPLLVKIYHSILMMNTITTRTPRLFPSVGLHVTNSSLDITVLQRSSSTSTTNQKKKWLEAEKMPQNLYKQFSEAGGDGDEGFDCVGMVTSSLSHYLVLTLCCCLIFIRKHGNGFLHVLIAVVVVDYVGLLMNLSFLHPSWLGSPPHESGIYSSLSEKTIHQVLVVSS
ncbi:hypothetical protein MKX01_017165 [Papaver californicum]|nr:hypothetical protein MKX01_017165 [Papaver californicum]